MASARRSAVMEALTWICLYGGLACLALGLATQGFDAAAAWLLGVAGALLMAAGVVLIWARSRLHDGNE